jgi:hypothetical protein
MKRAPMLQLVGGAGNAPARKWNKEDDELGSDQPQFVAAPTSTQQSATWAKAYPDANPETGLQATRDECR